MSSSYRVPRALHGGFDEHSEHEVIELHHNGLSEVLHSVRQTAADLLAQSPVPPSTLSVRAGTVAVEMSTTLPDTIRSLAPEVRACGAGLLDAPVSGSVSLARAGGPGSAPLVPKTIMSRRG